MKLEIMVWMYGIAIKVLNEYMKLQIKVWMIRNDYKNLKLRT